MRAQTNYEHPRAATVDEIIERHAAEKGATDDGAAWAKQQARNGLAAGLHESEASLAGLNELDLWMQYCDRIDPQVANACVHHGIDRFVRDAGMEAQA